MGNEEVFSKNYLKVLELVAKVDPKLVDQINKVANSLPRSMKTNMLFEESCSLDSVDKHIELKMYGDLMELQIVRYTNFLDTSIYLYPFYEDEILDDEEPAGDHYMLLCSLNVTNTEDEVDLTIHYTEKNGEYNFNGIKFPNNGREIDKSVYIDKIGDEYVLNSVLSLNNVEIFSKSQPITLDEILEYVIQFEEDLEDDEYDEDLSDLEFIDDSSLEDDNNFDIE